MKEKFYIVYDCDGDLVRDDIDSESEASELAGEVNGYYEEQ